MTALGRWSLRVPMNESVSKSESVSRSDGAEKSAQSNGQLTLPLSEARSSTEMASPVRTASIAEDWAWQLIRRWGIVFRDLIMREEGAPSWFELLQVLRRLEARGEIRGGRFIVGVGGEQFALADTIQQLRRLRDEVPQQEILVISAADPLNLVGIITRHDRVPRTASNHVAYLNGVPIATVQGGEMFWLQERNTDVENALNESIRRCAQ